jgi:hypothetical protein
MGEKRDGSGQGYVPKENGPEPETVPPTVSLSPRQMSSQTKANIESS